jgi:hypothetical protein
MSDYCRSDELWCLTTSRSVCNAWHRCHLVCHWLQDLQAVEIESEAHSPVRQGHRAAEPPAEGFAQNQLWCEIVALASDLLTWMQMLALTGTARRWEPKRLRAFSVAGRLVRGGRRLRPRPAERWPWAGEDHGRDHPPAGPPLRLTCRNVPATRKEKLPGPVESRPPGTPAGQPPTADT